MVTLLSRAPIETTSQKDMVMSPQRLLPDDLLQKEMMTVLEMLLPETCFQGKMMLLLGLVKFFLGHLAMSGQSLIRDIPSTRRRFERCTF